MQLDDPSSCIGRNVKDTYGRDLGRCIGYNVDLAGSLSSLGVESGSVFTEYPSEWVVSVKEDVVIIPEWKVDARRFGLEKGVLDKRLNALNEMLVKGEISQKVFDQMSRGLAQVRQSHDNLSQRLVRRLEELEEMDDRLNVFMARVKLQGVSEEIGESALKWTTDYCMAMQSMNEVERVEIRDVLDLLSKQSTSEREMKASGKEPEPIEEPKPSTAEKANPQSKDEEEKVTVARGGKKDVSKHGGTVEWSMLSEREKAIVKSYLERQNRSER